MAKMPDIPKVVPTTKPVIPLKRREGWGYIVNATTMIPSKKWHYFVEGRSLCRRYMRFNDADLEQRNDDSVDNCAECKRRLAKRQKQNASHA